MAFIGSAKPKPYCRSCRVFLNLYEIDNMHVYVCLRCDSKQVYLSELDKKISKRTIAEFESLGKTSKTRSTIDCGICGKHMRGVKLDESKIHLDICLYCQAIWFGGANQEYEAFLLEEISLKPKTRDLLKQDRVGELDRDTQFITENYNRLYRPLMVSHTHDRDFDTQYTPHISGAIFILTFLVTFIALRKPELFRSLAYTNSASFGHQALTAFTSFFVHASWSHWLGNALFYFMFADNVERKLGTRKFLELLAFSQIAYAAFFNYLYQGKIAYGVGASVGIAGLMAYYIISDPYRPVRQIIRAPWWFRGGMRGLFNYVTIVIPAWIYLILFVGKEMLGIKAEMAGATRTAHTGHLVGLLVGLLFYYVYPPPKYQSAAEDQK